MNERIVTTLKTCFTIFSAVLTFLLSIEMSARIDDAIKLGAPFSEKYSSDRLRKYDKNGIQINIPNARFEKWQHNSLGFRGPDITPVKIPGSAHVVCLGASESYGLYESPGKEWPAQLRTLLPASSYQVTNASVAGLVLQSFKPYVKNYVLPLKPDVVICFVNPSLYTLAWGKKHNQNIQGLPLKQVAMTRIEPKSNLKKIIVSNSRALPKIKQVFKGTVEATFPQMLQRYQVLNLKKQVEQAAALRLKGEKPRDTAPDAVIASFRADLYDLVSFIQSKGIKVMLSSYPSLADSRNLTVYPQFALDSRRSMVEYSNVGLLDIQDKLNSVIASVAVERGAMFVDSRSLVPKTTEYFGDVFHYTDNGAKLVAQGVASKLTNGSSLGNQVAIEDKNRNQQARWRLR